MVKVDKDVTIMRSSAETLWKHRPTFSNSKHLADAIALQARMRSYCAMVPVSNMNGLAENNRSSATLKLDKQRDGRWTTEWSR
jgi:hypothetical protein